MTPRRWTRLAWLVIACAAIYVGWNVYWLAHRQVPPSMALHLFGIPAPSTGMTRSVRAMREGQWRAAMQWNAFTLPILALYGASVGVLAWRACRRQRLVLPPWLGWGWLIVLVAAWVTKLVQGPAWW
jgi:hypothetical protein